MGGSKGNTDKSPDVKTDGEDVKTKLGTENQKKEEDISKTRRKRACTEKMEILKAAVTPPKKAKKSTEEMSPSKGPSVDEPKDPRDKRSKQDEKGKEEKQNPKDETLKVKNDKKNKRGS